MPVEVSKRELEFLRYEVLKKYFREAENIEIREGEEFRELNVEEKIQKFDEIKANTTLKSYNNLLDFINETLDKEYKHRFQVSILRKLFCYSKDEEFQNYQESVLDALYMFISDNKCNRIEYHKANKIKEGEEKRKIRNNAVKKQKRLRIDIDKKEIDIIKVILLGLVLVTSNLITFWAATKFFDLGSEMMVKEDIIKKINGRWSYEGSLSPEDSAIDSLGFRGTAQIRVMESVSHFAIDLHIQGIQQVRYKRSSRFGEFPNWSTNHAFICGRRMFYQCSQVFEGKKVPCIVLLTIIPGEGDKEIELSGEIRSILGRGIIIFKRAESSEKQCQ